MFLITYLPKNNFLIEIKFVFLKNLYFLFTEYKILSIDSFMKKLLVLEWLRGLSK